MKNDKEKVPVGWSTDEQFPSLTQEEAEKIFQQAEERLREELEKIPRPTHVPDFIIY